MLENILSLRRLAYIFPIIQPKRWKINKLGYNRLLTHCVSCLCCGWLTGDFLILYCSAAVAPPPVGARGVLLTRVKCAPRRCGAGVWRPLQCLNLHTWSDWMTDPSLPKKFNIFQLFDWAMTEPTAPTERTDPQCIARPSPLKVNGDQSTDACSGHGASNSILYIRYGLKLSGDACFEHQLPDHVLKLFGTSAYFW